MDARYEHTMLEVGGRGKFVVAVGDRWTASCSVSRDVGDVQGCSGSAAPATEDRRTVVSPAIRPCGRSRCAWRGRSTALCRGPRGSPGPQPRAAQPRRATRERDGPGGLGCLPDPVVGRRRANARLVSGFEDRGALGGHQGDELASLLSRVAPAHPRVVSELAPKHWRATRERLNPLELEMPISSFQVPPAPSAALPSA